MIEIVISIIVFLLYIQFIEDYKIVNSLVNDVTDYVVNCCYYYYRVEESFFFMRELLVFFDLDFKHHKVPNDINYNREKCLLKSYNQKSKRFKSRLDIPPNLMLFLYIVMFSSFTTQIEATNPLSYTTPSGGNTY